MVRRTFHLLIGLVGLVSFLYLFFFVSLGRHTLWEHVQAISATEPAQELGEDVRGAGERLSGEVRGAADRVVGPGDAPPPPQPPR